VAVTFWALLEVMAAAQAAVAAYMLYLVARLARTPLGARLALVAAVLTGESLAALAVYTHLQSLGYGRPVAAPLLAIQTMSLAGTLILVDTVRR